MKAHKLVNLLFLLLLAPWVMGQEENIQSPKDTIPGQGIDINVGSKTHFTLGGALWLRSAFQHWQQNDDAS